MGCDKLGLLVNADKTGLVAFIRRTKLPGFFEQCLFGRTLRCSMSVKYLGVVLDVKARRLTTYCGPVGGPMV
jgi:hypothetical protein